MFGGTVTEANAVPARGDIVIQYQTSGADITVPFTSPVGVLNFSLAAVGGSASRTFLFINAGQITVTAGDIAALGQTFSSISCDDANSTTDLASRTATINLQHRETVTCVFTSTVTSTSEPETSTQSPDRTPERIATFLGNRNTLVLANQARIGRRINRLRFCETGGASDDIIDGTGAVAISPSLNRIAASTDGRRLDPSYSCDVPDQENVGDFDLWVEGTLARFSDAASSNGKFAVIHAGVDFLANERLLVGLAAQLDRMSQRNSDNAGSVNGTGWMVGPYATLQIHEKLFLDLRAAAGQSRNSISPLGTYSDRFGTNRFLLSGALVGDLVIGEYTIQPRLSVNYMTEHQKGYVNGVGVVISPQTVSQSDIRFGPKVTRAFVTRIGTLLSAFARIEAAHAFGNRGDFTSGSLARDNIGFSATIEGGIDHIWASGASIGLSAFYAGLGNASDFYGGSLKFSLPIR